MIFCFYLTFQLYFSLLLEVNSLIFWLSGFSSLAGFYVALILLSFRYPFICNPVRALPVARFSGLVALESWQGCVNTCNSSVPNCW